MHKIEFCVIFGHTRRTSRTSAHNPFVRVFVCLCAMPEISEATRAGREDNPCLGGQRLLGEAVV